MNSIVRLLFLLLIIVTAQADTAGGSETAIKESAATRETVAKMKGSHLHLSVKDLPAALRWLNDVWRLEPTFHNERMAVLPFGEISIILDASTSDTIATLGFDSQNCDGDFLTVKARGGRVIEEPRDRPWGVRSAYVQGPGALKFEIEQALPSQN